MKYGLNTMSVLATVVDSSYYTRGYTLPSIQPKEVEEALQTLTVI